MLPPFPFFCFFSSYPFIFPFVIPFRSFLFPFPLSQVHSYPNFLLSYHILFTPLFHSFAVPLTPAHLLVYLSPLPHCRYLKETRIPYAFTCSHIHKRKHTPFINVQPCLTLALLLSSLSLVIPQEYSSLAPYIPLSSASFG
jgi:hypothetical protein